VVSGTVVLGAVVVSAVVVGNAPPTALHGAVVDVATPPDPGGVGARVTALLVVVLAASVASRVVGGRFGARSDGGVGLEGAAEPAGPDCTVVVVAPGAGGEVVVVDWGSGSPLPQTTVVGLESDVLVPTTPPAYSEAVLVPQPARAATATAHAASSRLRIARIATTFRH